MFKQFLKKKGFLARCACLSLSLSAKLGMCFSFSLSLLPTSVSTHLLIKTCASFLHPLEICERSVHFTYEPVYEDFGPGNGGQITNSFLCLYLSLWHTLSFGLFLFFSLSPSLFFPPSYCESMDVFVLYNKTSTPAQPLSPEGYFIYWSIYLQIINVFFHYFFLYSF